MRGAGKKSSSFTIKHLKDYEIFAVDQSIKSNWFQLLVYPKNLSVFHFFLSLLGEMSFL